jgi:hypothetical protein
MKIKCPECGTTAEISASGRLSVDPPARCSELRGTTWGDVGEYEWCPLLAAQAPAGIVLPGKAERAMIMAEIARVRSQRK